VSHDWFVRVIAVESTQDAIGDSRRPIAARCDSSALPPFGSIVDAAGKASRAVD